MPSCFTCQHFGERLLGHHVWCAEYKYVRAEPEAGCAFWRRCPGADDEAEPQVENKVVDWDEVMRRNRRPDV